MRVYFYILIAWLLPVVCPQAFAQSTVIYQDDFEGTVTGWSVNNTDFDPDVTRFLGRFDNNPQSTSRTFTIPAGTDRVEIEFDFYRFDSWDNNGTYGFDRFQVDIDGTQIFSLPFPNPQAARSGTTGNVEWSHSPLGPREELAFGTGQYWFDQLHRVQITVNNPGPSLALTLRTAVNQGGNDESGGFDNMTITAFPVLPDLTAAKTVETVNSDYALPGNDVEYTVTIGNTGGPVDAGSLRFIDALPATTTLFTGDLDGAGNSVIFEDNSVPASGLTCCSGANIDYSDSVTTPPVFGYIPTSDYDDAITYIRIIPAGSVRDSQSDPVSVNFKFRSRIK